MTNCEYCDYYKNMGNSGKEANGRAYCSFAKVVLLVDPGKPETQYPCRDMTYQEYLDRDKGPAAERSRLKQVI